MSVIFKALSQLDNTAEFPVGRPGKGRPLVRGLRNLWLAVASIMAAFLMVGLVWSYQAAGIAAGRHVHLESGPAGNSGPAKNDVGVVPEVVFRPATRPVESDLHFKTVPVTNSGQPEPGGGTLTARPGLVSGVDSARFVGVQSSRTVPAPKVAGKLLTFQGKTSGSDQTSMQRGYPGERSVGNGRRHSDAMSNLTARRRQTAELVSRIRNRLADGDNIHAAALINELAAGKGSDDLLVMKLRAYLFIRQSQWSKAEALLGRVLEIQPEDVDAALNLAAVQINTGRFNKARAGLEQLYLRYPEDDRIAQWLERIAR